MVAAARARAEGLGAAVSFQVGDVYALPFASESFDAARMDRVLHVLTSPLSALREAARVVRRGGRIVVMEPIWASLDVSGGEETLTRLVLAKNQAMREIGAVLPDVLPRVGVRLEIKQDAQLVLHEFTAAARLFGLKQAARWAVEAGRLSVAAAAVWLSSLEDASHCGEFEATLTGMIVCGLKT